MTRGPNNLGRRRVPLPGGGVLTVRPVATTDVDGLVALYDGLSDDDRYRRFFSGFRPPRSFFERLVNVGERGGFGLVATMGGGGEVAGDARVVGEASYELLPNGDGELAITVAADQRGWLGPYLLDALVEAAAARGVRNLEADVLVTNGRMLALLRSRGYATMGSNDWTTLRLVVGTAGRTPVWPAGRSATGHTDRPKVLVEVASGRWHPGVPVCVERRAGRGPRDQPRLGAPEGGSAVSVDEDQDPRMIVDLVDRLASRHRIAACDPPAPAPRRNGRS